VAAPRGFDASAFAPLSVPNVKTGKPIIAVDQNGVLDLRRLADALKQVDPQMKKELGKANREAGKIVADATKAKLSSGADSRFNGSDATLAAAKATVRAQNDAWRVSVTVGAKPGSSKAMANLAFWGAKNRMGWFSRPQFDGYTSFEQGFANWVGGDWGDLTSGDGPYFLSPAVAENQKKIVDKFEDGIDRVMREAGFR
jgi:hypothetical protein